MIRGGFVVDAYSVNFGLLLVHLVDVSVLLYFSLGCARFWVDVMFGVGFCSLGSF